MDETLYVCEPHYDENGNFDHWNPLFPYRRGTCEVECVTDEFYIAFHLSCGHQAIEDRPSYCPVCGAKVVE